MRVDMTVSQVTRELMARADVYPDTFLADDQRGGTSKLGSALLKLTNRSYASEPQVRDFVQKYAGADDRLDTGEFTAMSDAIRGVTATLPADKIVKWPEPSPLGITTRFLLNRADADLDGVIGQSDVAAGSDYATSILDVLGETSLTHAAMEPALRRVFPGDDPNASAAKFLNRVYKQVIDRGTVSISVGDWVRGDVQRWNTNQDLQLTPEDGASAFRTLHLAGGIKAARSGELWDSVAKFDVHHIDGTPGPDGRLDQPELLAYSRAWLAAPTSDKPRT